MKIKQINQVEWKEVELKEIAQFVNGRAFKPSEWEPKGKLIIRIQDLTGSITNPNYTTKKFEGKYLVKRGDLLISWSATLDAFIWDKEEGWLNQHIFKVVPKGDFIDKEYLFYFVKRSINLFMRETHGSTMKHITKGRFESIKIPLPPFPTQKAIVSILEKAEHLKEKRKQTLEFLDDYLKSVFSEVFLKEKFEEKEIRELCDTTSGGTPSRIKKEYWENGTILWVKSGELDKGYIHNTEEKITELGLKNSSAKYLEPNTVLIAMYGASVGKISMLKIRATTNQAICSLIPKDNNLLNNIYLLYFLGSIKKKLVSSSFGGGQPNISQQVIKSIKIPLPPLKLQQTFASIVEHVEKIKEKQKQSLEEIEQLNGVLMQKAFKGELVR